MKIPNFLKADKLLRIEDWWTAHRHSALNYLSFLMALVALVKLGDEFARLLFEFHKTSAVDLKLFAILTHDWFACTPVYQLHSFSTYPPASHLIFWPLFGNFQVASIRIAWAILTVGLLIWLARFSVGAGRAQSQSKQIQWFLALIPLSMNSVGVAIGNGQLTLVVIALICSSLRYAREDKNARSMQLFAAFLFFVALVKPSLSVPFFWVLLFMPGSLVPSLATAGAYGLATLYSSQFQGGHVLNLLGEWIGRAAEIELGYANLHTLLQSIGMKQLFMPLQFALLLALGLWVNKNRKVDSFIVLGVVALFARFWTYHAVYDDAIVIFAILAIYRISQRKPLRLPYQFPLEWLVAVNILVMLAPARMRYFPQPLSFLFKGGHTFVWLVDLALLLYFARQDRILKSGSMESI
jgi:hypothetical protein